MKKFIAVCLLAAMTSSAFASQTRLGGLGVANWMIEDDFNIWLNPAQINNYKGIVYGELGTYNPPVNNWTPNSGIIASQWGGVNLDTGFGIIGLYLERPYAGALSLDVDNDGTLDSRQTIGDAGIANIAANGILNVTGAGGFLNSEQPLAPNSHKFDLIYGIKMTDSINLGARLSYASTVNNKKHEYATDPNAAANDGTVDNQRNSSQVDIIVGALLKDLAVFKSIDAALTISMPKLKVSHAENAYQASGVPDLTESLKIDSDNSMNMGVLLRGVNEIGDETKLITTLQYQNLDNSTKYVLEQQTDGDTPLETNQTDTRTNKLSTVRLDGSINTSAGKNMLVIVSAGIESSSGELSAKRSSGPVDGNANIYTRENDSIKVSQFQIPLVVAVEHKTSKVLTSRLGITKPIMQTTEETIVDRDYNNVGVMTNKTETKTLLDADVPIGVTAGVGLNILKDLVIDATISQQILFDGPHFISGVPNSVFGQLTASYRF